MTVKLEACVISEDVAIDSLTGRITASNMLDHVYAPSYPALLAKLIVSMVYTRDEGTEHAPYSRRSRSSRPMVKQRSSRLPRLIRPSNSVTTSFMP